MKKIISRIAFAFAAFVLAFVFLGQVSVRTNASEVKVERTLRVADTNYKLVTSKSQLVVGRKVIIAANNANYAVSATQGTSYRMGETFTKSGSYAIPSSNVGLFTLANGTKSGTYGFYDDNYGYLYSTSNGTLKADQAHDGYSSFSLTISSNGNVVAKTYSKSLYLKYYSGSVAFAASTSKSNVYLYQAEEATTQPTQPTTGKAAWTIMIYMCGADLESNYGLATSDIQEILAVSGQPSDVNIIIQTGGAAKWKTTYGINANYTQRYHVANKKLVLDSQTSLVNMGQASSFASFLQWGLTSYPAEKTGVIMWNHGGAMRGVCYDENYDSDSLLNSEVKSALSTAFANTGRTQKLEFIGYDACLMSVQDVAEFNSQYFNYMVASEESESGYGWDYDTWVDDLYAKKSTTTILKAVVDGFIKDNGGTSSSSNNQTLAYLNLAYMAAYKNAWETMASKLASKLTSSNKNSFNTLVKSCKHYADSDYTYFGTFDAKDFINKLASNSTFNPGSTYTSAVLTAFNNLVEYSSCGKGAGNSNGLCMFWSVSSNCAKGTYYTASQTNFTNWRSLVSTYGA